MPRDLYTGRVIRRIILMGKDYIVEDVRRIREEQAAKYNFDIKAILGSAKKRQRKSGRRVVSFISRKRAAPQQGQVTQAT